MNNYDTFQEEFEDCDPLLSYLPLDWNEELTLEEYLERVENHQSKKTH